MSDLDTARAALRERQGAGARHDAAAAPAGALAMARRGRAYLARIVNGLDDESLWAESAREGFSRRRVIAAAALEARAIAQVLEDATGRTGDRADTDAAALDLAETLPDRALRHLAAHAEVHLNVVWRDLTDAEWDLPVRLASGEVAARDTAHMHALTLWRAAIDLRAGGRLRDIPAALAQDLTHP
ncbi:hypothetical protein [Paracoccus spongiarum]|uniref:Maleylpyruvate isomerase n=1 Tax=Paracoccus spongiarum TaxID=3064387 RepID=A0ABT9JAE3_9RHOB|nr:hypothetical protein [Paracoccus sp. 2205BS29-5]MDP5306634.1 hypothetical protein [Paracoccus sp. 2205BS29-5]